MMAQSAGAQRWAYNWALARKIAAHRALVEARRQLAIERGLDLSWAKLVRTFGVDLGEELLDLVGDGVLGGDHVAAGLDGDLPVAA